MVLALRVLKTSTVIMNLRVGCSNTSDGSVVRHPAIVAEVPTDMYNFPIPKRIFVELN